MAGRGVPTGPAQPVHDRVAAISTGQAISAHLRRVSIRTGRPQFRSRRDAFPESLWAPSLSAVWASTAAITAAYAPPAVDVDVLPDGDAQAALDRAVAHGDEHVIKFTDTAVDVYERTGDPRALAAAARITELL